MYYFRVYRSFAQNTDSLANYDDGSCVYETFLDTLDNNSSEDCIFLKHILEIQVLIWQYFSPLEQHPLFISSDSPYVVASTPEGLTVGSASFASADLIGGQQSLAVWGDDTTTPEIDGAVNGEELIFQLIDGNSLYDLNLSFAGLNSFTTNGQLPVIASSAELNCSSSSLEQGPQVTGCMHSIACNFDSLATSPSICTYANIGYDCGNN